MSNGGTRFSMNSNSRKRFAGTPPWVRYLVLLAAGLCLAGTHAGAREIRIGILATEPEARTGEDLLTAVLSGQTNVAMVERTELVRIVQEQALSRDNLVRVGQLLRADGLIILQAAGDNQRKTLEVRLVSMQTGAVLGSARYPLPLKEPAEWGKVVSGQLGRLIPKLEVLRQDALPLSILNLRSAINSAASVQAERQLTALLIHRLSNQKEVFVLERRSLAGVQAEKELPGPEEAPFWNGSYLAEGVIDQEGFSPATITVDLKLTPPGNARAVQLRVSGERQNLPALVEKLANQILEALQKQASGPAWQPEREAAQYLEEARWAWRWGMAPETKMAADAAWALGLRTVDVATLRVHGHSVGAQVGYRRNDRPEYYFDAEYYDPFAKTGWTTNEPPASAYGEACDMVDNYLEYCRTGAPSWRTNDAWLSLGMEALQTTALLLRNHYNYAAWKPGADRDLSRLRELGRELDAGLPPELKLLNRGYFGSPDLDRDLITELSDISLSELRARHGALWQEGPAAGVAMYRRMRGTAQYPLQREHLAVRHWRNPRLAAWAPEARSAAESQWNAYIDELIGSADRRLQADGWLFRLADARFDPEIARALEEVLRVTMDPEQKNYRTEIDFEFLKTLDRLVQLKCKEPETMRKNLIRTNFQALRFPFIKHYLRQTRVHNSDVFVPICQDFPYTEAQAREVALLLAEYRKRFERADWVASVRETVAAKANYTVAELKDFLVNAQAHDQEEFKARLDFGLRDSRQYTPEMGEVLLPVVQAYREKFNLVLDTVRVEAKLRGTRQTAIAPLTPPKLQSARTTEVMPVKRAWPVNVSLPGNRKALQPVVHSFAHHAKGLLIGALYYDADKPDPGQIGPSAFYALLELNLETLRANTLVAGLSPRSTIRDPGPEFAVLAQDVYLLHSSNQLRCFNLTSKAARDIRLPFEPGRNSKVHTAKGRVFVVSPEIIAEVIPASNEVKIVASARRKPAASKLDERSQWEPETVIFERRDGALAIAVPSFNRLESYVWDEPAAQWKEGPSLPLQGSRTDFVDGRFSIRSMFSGYRASVWNGLGMPTHLLDNNAKTVAQWAFPMDVNLMGSTLDSHLPALYDGRDIFAFFTVLESRPASPPAQPNTFTVGAASDRDVTLWWFDHRWEIPTTIPLKFAALPDVRPIQRWEVRLLSDDLMFLEAHIMQMEAPALWFVSKGELEAWTKALPRSTNSLPRRFAGLIPRFDQNKNGVLDEEDTALMAGNPGFQAENEDFDARRLVETFDRDGNGGLETAELEMARRGSQTRFFIAPGPASSTKEWLATLDRNRNQNLEPAELRVMAQLRPPGPQLPGGGGGGVILPGPAGNPGQSAYNDSLLILRDVFGFAVSANWKLGPMGSMVNGDAEHSSAHYFIVRTGDQALFEATLKQMKSLGGEPMSDAPSKIPSLPRASAGYSFWDADKQGDGYWKTFSARTNGTDYKASLYLFQDGPSAKLYYHVNSEGPPKQQE